MPITELLCSGCGGRKVPLDHFQTTLCGVRILHPSYVSACLERRGRKHTPGERVPVGVTYGLGCPRQAAIQKTEDYAADPSSFNAAQVGTARHRHLESHPAEGASHEQQFYGLIDGVLCTAIVDCVRRQRDIIDDFKHKNDFGRSGLVKAPSPDHECQLSMGAELIEESIGWRPKQGALHYLFSAGKPITHVFNLWTLDRVLSYKPLYGKATVQELLHQMEDFYTGKKAWKDLPLTGEEQYFTPFVPGKKRANKCSYCEVKTICFTEAGRPHY